MKRVKGSIPVTVPPPLTVDDVIDTLARVMKEKRNIVITEPDLRYLYEALVELLITETIDRGNVRLPGGWGSLVLRVLNERGTPRMIPGGGTVPVAPRAAIRFREGLALREVLGKLSPSEYKRQTPRKSKL